MAKMKTSKRKVIDFTKDEEELLIELIKNRPAIYDSQNEYYKNAHYRNQRWSEVSNIIEKSVADCKTRWRSLRDTYKKKITKFPDERWDYTEPLSFLKDCKYQNSNQANTLGTESIEIIADFNMESDIDETIDQEEMLIEPNVVEEDPFENFQQNYRKYGQTNPQMKPMQTQQSRHFRPMLKKDRFIEELKASRKERTKLLKSLCATQKEHPTEILFKGLAQTVMTFPPSLAAEAKLKVCQIVSELECRLHNTNTSTSECPSSSVVIIKQEL